MTTFSLSKQAAQAVKGSTPVVALESAVITHGLPHSHNPGLARDMESVIHEQGATPQPGVIVEQRPLPGPKTGPCDPLLTR
jgi:pseudouridine-5'-phosphate glycosidase